VSKDKYSLVARYNNIGVLRHAQHDNIFWGARINSIKNKHVILSLSKDRYSLAARYNNIGVLRHAQHDNVSWARLLTFTDAFDKLRIRRSFTMFVLSLFV